MSLPPLLFQGSVKDILGVKGESPYIFSFSDRYSLFDWGEMPDAIPDKGAALAIISTQLFRLLGDANSWQKWEIDNLSVANRFISTLNRLKAEGVSNHLVEINNEGVMTNLMAVSPVDILMPSYDENRSCWNYQAYNNQPSGVLVPLEVIFRFGVPAGSSLLERVDCADYRQEIGLQKIPKSGERFTCPIIEFSTKLESSDRYISYEEARKISGMTSKEQQELIALTSLIALRLKELFAQGEVELWDGKFEFAFASAQESGQRSFMLVDAIGPDELRLTHQGVQLSKESLRQLYRNTEWWQAVVKAKNLA
ncbi:MAG: hypothetical protein HN623_03630, partial [Bdellovibrionales bacterium]|nr:hypothetical protein [Bdellovibrionales bacterium]